MYIIVDMSHEASIISTWQAIDLHLLLEDQTLPCETNILITNQYLFLKLIRYINDMFYGTALHESTWQS